MMNLLLPGAVLCHSMMDQCFMVNWRLFWILSHDTSVIKYRGFYGITGSQFSEHNKTVALCVLYYLAGKYLTSVHCKIFDLNIIISSEAGDWGCGWCGGGEGGGDCWAGVQSDTWVSGSGNCVDSSGETETFLIKYLTSLHPAYSPTLLWYPNLSNLPWFTDQRILLIFNDSNELF